MNIETEYPNAVGPDFDYPHQGASQNNHSNPIYLKELERVTKKQNFKYMDLGCAGGQSVVDLYKKGYIACGVEGSDLQKMLSESQLRSKPEPRFLGDTESHIEDVHHNWLTYKDVCLFKADITKPFTIKEKNNIQKFDVITAWDVLEHPQPDDIGQIIQNIKNHLEKDGIFICLINLVPSLHHQCIKSKEWWLKLFNQYGFEDIGFTINASPRHTQNPLGSNDLGFMFKLKEV
jgi:2-polyprenyl-3-methyl-5-hydroxy-6-metoxy-1,4-benzoquinol methylase